MRTTPATTYTGVLRLLPTKTLYDLATTAGIERPYNIDRIELVRRLSARHELRTHAAEAIKALLLDQVSDAPISEAAE